MVFSDFNSHIQEHVNNMAHDHNIFFTTDVDKELLWQTYLNSFPQM